MAKSNYQGHGYGAEAFGEKIRFAFEELKLRRLDNGFFEGNTSSLKDAREVRLQSGRNETESVPLHG